MSTELRVLLGKEWKQAIRNRGALLTATALPLLLLLVVPVAQAIAAANGIGSTNMPAGVQLPPGMNSGSPKDIFVWLSFPLFLVVGGLVVPSVAASYTIVSEREKRTVDLLLALPVSLGQIVAAKVGAIAALALAITLPLVLIDFVVLGALGLAEPLLMAGYLFEFLTSLFFSVTSAVAVALLARDFRTSNNLNGAFMGPMILIALAFSMLLPGGVYRLFLHGGLMAVAGGVVLWAALKGMSLERYAS